MVQINSGHVKTGPRVARDARVALRAGSVAKPVSETGFDDCGRPCSSGIMSHIRLLFREDLPSTSIVFCCPSSCAFCGGNSTHKCNAKMPKWCCPFTYTRSTSSPVSKMRLTSVRNLDVCANSTAVDCLMTKRGSTMRCVPTLARTDKGGSMDPTHPSEASPAALPANLRRPAGKATGKTAGGKLTGKATGKTRQRKHTES